MKMMRWLTDSESDDEPLNLNLFIRKSFGFEGLPKEKEINLKNVVQGLGAVCDNLPKYLFTTSEYFLSLANSNIALYNVTYIRDCIDANRCLSIEQYRFGPKYSEKKDYREFDPCCHNFHEGKDACTLCDSAFKDKEEPLVQDKKNKKRSKLSVVKSNMPVKKVKKNPMCTWKNCTHSLKPHPAHKSNSWESWEHRLMLDYIIGNNYFAYCKGPSLYKRMIAEGYLKHRSPESMRLQFRTVVLKGIESYNLPKPILQKFKKIRALEVKKSYQLQKMFNKIRFRDTHNEIY